MAHYLYLILNVLSFSIPFAYSFERKRMHFIQYWKSYFTAIALVGLVFILWDIYFTYIGVWGFNDDYLVGWRILKLPIEEWMFFFLIPYASNFIHYALLYFFPKPALKDKTAHRLATLLFIVTVAIAIGNYDKAYTLASFGLFALLMLIQLKFKFKVFNRYVLSFVVILIPFIIVNSWLTGSFTSEPVVWYHNAENLGIRVGTIPIEDFFYCFTMLYPTVLIFDKLKIK
ncbi:MAG: lycopene cyclase domain-containing protein [Weeksellaceae bacterium]